jgi:hypothetical protein
MIQLFRYAIGVLVLSSCTLGNLSAQNSQVFSDEVFADYIRSVKFHIEGIPLSAPLIDLNSNTRLVLTFDDLQGDGKDYKYSIHHCNADWTPSNLAEMEYLVSFQEEYINDYEFSFNTRTNFTNYLLALPNRDIGWTKSGNYILKVFDVTDDRFLVFTRRFMVVETGFKVMGRVINPRDVSLTQTHQEIDFFVGHKGIDIRNPQTEVYASVLQNGRWDNAIIGLPPRFSRGEELNFDYQNRVVFPAGKEFRFLDIRTLNSKAEKIERIDRLVTHFEVRVRPEPDRETAPYLFEQDINGKFVIQTFDAQDQDLAADYADVFFQLKSSVNFSDHDVYIIGGFTDWLPMPWAKMAYNPAVSGYVGKVRMKQGFYNYAYGLVPSNGGPVDYAEFEGNWYETENDYLILAYYRPFGERYDRLMGAAVINSND